MTISPADGNAGDLDGALALARQAEQASGDMPGLLARNWSAS